MVDGRGPDQDTNWSAGDPTGSVINGFAAFGGLHDGLAVHFRKQGVCRLREGDFKRTSH